MNYELAKQLKDAGFPQFGQPRTYAYKLGLERILGPYLTSADEFYVPTLSELIAACGDHEFHLHFVQHERKWQTWISLLKAAYVADEEHSGEGQTPEEAVARLWLALNTKPHDHQ